MEIEQLINEIAAALEIDVARVSPESDSTMIEEWDSLGQISILSRLDSAYDNITERVPDLASVVSVAEIFRLLKANGI
jgi:hypothetical protein